MGVGEGRPRDWRAAGAAAVRALRDAPGAAVGAGDGPRAATLAPARPEDLPETADDWASLALGVVLGSHRFSVKSIGPRRPR